MAAKTRPLLWSLLLLGGAIVLTVAALAQDLSSRMPAGVPGFNTEPDRETPPDKAYQPLGLRDGQITLFPRVSAGIGYDSNILGTPAAKGGWTFGSHAGLLAQTEWSRPKLSALFSVDDTRVPGAPAQSQTNGTAALGGSADIGADRLNLGGAYLALHQDRTELGALPSDKPIPYQVEAIRGDYAIALGRLTLTPSFSAEVYQFGNTTIGGVPVSQKYRNRDVFAGGLAASWETAPGRDLLLVGRGLSSRYTSPQPGVAAPDSLGWELLGGIDDKIDGLWRVRLLLGLEQRHFSSAAYRTHTAPMGEVDVTWSPSALLDLTATVSRTIEDPAQEGVAGYVATTARLSAAYWWRRNVLLDASAAVQQAVYLGSDGVQTGFAFGAGATWWASRRLRVSATESVAALRGGSSAAPGQTSYTRSISLLSAGFGL